MIEYLREVIGVRKEDRRLQDAIEKLCFSNYFARIPTDLHKDRDDLGPPLWMPLGILEEHTT
jgi:hypothetical protein